MEKKKTFVDFPTDTYELSYIVLFPPPPPTWLTVTATDPKEK